MFNYKEYENASLIYTKPVQYYGHYEKIGIYHKMKQTCSWFQISI